MAILLVILLITLGLAFRAAAVSRRVSMAGTDSDTGLMDAYARTSLLVLLSLLGLFALGLAYGNVLGASAGS